MDFEVLVGEEVVEAKDLKNGGFALLFEDGYVLVVGSDEAVTFADGKGWEELWNSLS